VSDPNNTISPEKMHEVRFVGLVQMLGSLALNALGKLADPSTGKEGEVNLEHAREMIDLLDMLEAKTKGNLSNEERRFLDLQLTNLRLTYVDEVNAQKK
jgi:hypothetical protein